MTTVLVDSRSKLGEQAPATCHLASRFAIGASTRPRSEEKSWSMTASRDLLDPRGTKGLGEIGPDFEHHSIPGTSAYQASRDPRPLAACGAIDVVATTSSIGSSHDDRRPALTARVDQDISPAVVTDSDGRLKRIHSPGLTRACDIENLRDFS